MNTKEQVKAESRETLLKWIKPGSTVYTILDHVSRSGMQRKIRVVVPYIRDDGTVDFIHPNYAIADFLGLRQDKRSGALIVSGCGMDMGFHVVYSLSAALFCPDKYDHGKAYSLQHKWL